jgi:hypothetical protein
MFHPKYLEIPGLIIFDASLMRFDLMVPAFIC